MGKSFWLTEILLGPGPWEAPEMFRLSRSNQKSQMQMSLAFFSSWQWDTQRPLSHLSIMLP